MTIELEPGAFRTADKERSQAQGPGGTAASEAQRMADAGKEQAKAMWSDTKESVRSALNDKQTSTAADLHEFASALRNAARNVERKGGVSRFAEHTADGLERLSGTLRSKDLDGLVHDVETFARSQPAVFLGMAVAAGFLAVRFLRSSEHAERQPRSGPAYSPESDPYAEPEQFR